MKMETQDTKTWEAAREVPRRKYIKEKDLKSII